MLLLLLSGFLDRTSAGATDSSVSADATLLKTDKLFVGVNEEEDEEEEGYSCRAEAIAVVVVVKEGQTSPPTIPMRTNTNNIDDDIRNRNDFLCCSYYL